MQIPEIIQKINKTLEQFQGKAYVVGGAVRDGLLGISPKDFDVEVYNMSLSQLDFLFREYGAVKEVGESFGVLKFTCPEGNEYDFSIPRKDNKTGKGHKEFLVETNPEMSIEEAASRRDFTINAILYSLSENKYIDPYNGIQDLQMHCLRHVSPAFSEDPLRVLRAMQFAGRFTLWMQKETQQLCQTIAQEHSNLAKERVWQEWYKWASKSICPGNGLFVLQQTKWAELYPEIQEILSLPQQPEWHPEGDVITHTRFTVNAAAQIAERENLSSEDKAILVLAALCHDFGKAKTTQVVEGRIISPEHDKAGEELAYNFLVSIGAPNRYLEAIPALVREHMIHVGGKLTERTVRRLSVRLADRTTIKMLSMLIEADHSGRPPLPAKNPCPELLTLAEELQVSLNKPEPFLQGRHLISLGLTPGKQFGELIRQSFELQLDGQINSVEQAVEWLRKEI